MAFLTTTLRNPGIRNAHQKALVNQNGTFSKLNVATSFVARLSGILNIWQEFSESQIGLSRSLALEKMGGALSPSPGTSLCGDRGDRFIVSFQQVF